MSTTGTPRPGSKPGSRPTPPSGGGRGGRRSGSRSPWRKVKIFFQVTFLLILLSVLGFIGLIAFLFHNAPTSADLTFTPPGRTQIFSSDNVLLAQLSTQNRQVVGIDQIPPNLQHATIAFEDKRFYTHNGVDPIGIFRAMARNVATRDFHGQGGSTITQQLARNLGVSGLTSKKTITRKLHEWVVANQIEKNYTKQQILEMYLNQVNYGSGAYGVQAAAQTYFGKNVKDLDLAQCALLAGIPNRPAAFSPYKDKAASKQQRNVVLRHMLEQGFITQQQFNQASTEAIKLPYSKPPGQGNQIFAAPFFVNYAIDQLRKIYPATKDPADDLLLQGNMKVYTTLNYKMQRIAEETIRDHIDTAARRGPNQACLVAMDPKTGEIKAMVGGVDYKKSNFNLVTQARRQPGSLFKAIVYSAAIDSGAFTEDSRIYDGPVTFHTGGGRYTPQDDNGYSYRQRTLRQAMAYSINVPAVKVLDEITPDVAVKYARVMGISPDTPLVPVLSLALGSSPVTPLEMTDVYATIANGGNHPNPQAFIRINNSNTNELIQDFPPDIDLHVLQPETVHQLDDMLRAVVTERGGTGASVASIDEARGKTGTTQGHKDVWFVGYNPDLACGVWAGHPLDDKRNGASYGLEMPGGTWGATVCAPIWRDFMRRAIPIFRSAKAKETARVRAANGAVSHPHHAPAAAVTSTADSVDQGASADTSDAGAQQPRSRHHAAPAAAAPENTVTVNVDDDTGLLAPNGSPHSAPVTFESGKQPDQMAPSYSDASPSSASISGNPTPAVDQNADNTDNSNGDVNADAVRPRRRRHHRYADTTMDSSTGDSSDSGTDTRRYRRRRDADTVTVRINPEDGLLATRWTPEYVEKTYARGTEPHRHSRMYGPPPGER